MPADRVAEIPEEALEAMERELEAPHRNRSDLEINRAAMEAALSALPSEWLLARCFTKAELMILSMDETHEGRPCGSCDDLRAEARAKLSAALSLEQEAGGER